MKNTMALLLAVLMLFGTALADWNCSSCGRSASGNFCSNCGQAKSDELPIFSEYTNSTKNMLRATINGERITFYLKEAELDDWLGKSYTVAIGTFVAYYPNGKVRCGMTIQLPEDIDSNKTVTKSSKDVYKFTYYTGRRDANNWESPAYRLWRGKMYNDDNHVKYGSFSLTTGSCDGSHYSGKLDCTLTAAPYKSGGYQYDGSDTVTIEDIEFDYRIGYVHPVFNELGMSLTGKTTFGTPNVNPNTGYEAEPCFYCDGMGWTECRVCDTFGMCMACDGFGHYTRFGVNGMEYIICSACGGSGACAMCGYSGFLTCVICGGTGKQY